MKALSIRQPVRIQRKRTRGWKMPENTVYVGRPTILGNPFTHPDAQVAVNEFRKWLTAPCSSSHTMEPGKLQFAKQIHPDALHFDTPRQIRNEILPKLKGKNLACWCPLDQPCHADVLLELANQSGE